MTVADDLVLAGLTHDELQELWLGPSHRGSLFRSREELRDAWARGRELAMGLWAKHGHRPMGWWQFERPPGLKFDFAHEKSILYNAGLLADDERRELEKSWRRQFDLAQKNRDPDAWDKLYQEADIPESLVQAWTAGAAAS
jgi:hypothetical protein